MALRWFEAAIGCEGAPVLFADRNAYRAWRGATKKQKTDKSDYERVVVEEGFALPADVVSFGSAKLGLVDSEGDNVFDVGWDEREAIVFACYADEDDPKRAAHLRGAVGKRKHPEYLVGELEIGDGGLVVANSAASAEAIAGAAPTEAGPVGREHVWLPLPAGKYTVVEGRNHEDDYDAWWCRIVPASKKKIAKRPAAAPTDPVAGIMARVSFKDANAEARALEEALELIAHGRADLALSLCDRASKERRWLASFTRVLALSANRDARASDEARALAEAWLRPADARDAANQMLTRAQVLRALDAAGDVEALRARVAAAPEPDVFVEQGDDFF